MFIRRFALPAAALALLGLTACVPTEADLTSDKVPDIASECTAKTRAGAQCAFRNAPLQLDPKPVKLSGRPYTFFPIARTLEFLDGKSRRWSAPQGTLTDGASIPQVFVPVVGSPRTPQFAAAAAVHDAYCGVGNEDGPVFHAAKWQDVHRVFYDTLIAGGTPEVKAKVMFAAVWLAGPRWNLGEKGSSNPVAGIPQHILVTYMGAIENHIELNNPTIPILIPYLNSMLIEMRALAFPAGSEPLQRRGQNNPPTTGNGPILGVIP
jgi:Protein of unknown function (DUF1353)